MPAATRSIVIDTPPDRLFDLIVDYDRYVEFLPEVKEAKSFNRRGNEVDVAYGIDVVKRIHYTLHHVEERPRAVRWTFVKGELMRDNHVDPVRDVDLVAAPVEALRLLHLGEELHVAVVVDDDVEQPVRRRLDDDAPAGSGHGQRAPA